MLGSSPHTRGARGRDRRRGLPGGIIPAYAGSTAPRRTGRFGRTDHPRIRGEHSSKDSGTASKAGIIPAYAGSTRPTSPPRYRQKDHPRIRGEHCWRLLAAPTACGSSPHTRGALRQGFRGLERAGIIPAYAGSTPGCRTRPRISRDHPRIRGEHADGRTGFAIMRGSSPHTRGARPSHLNLAMASRIIPAYAGSTEARSNDVRGRRDHPRIRGEHSPVEPSYSKHEGSSPHTRGARSESLYQPDAGGIIPAYAGSTRPSARGRHRRTDHPRIRGEHQCAGIRLGERSGSSPHTRGARRASASLRRPRRIIPAYAGSTLS